MPVFSRPEPMLTIAPAPRASMAGISAFMHRNVPSMLTAAARRQSARSISARGLRPMSSTALFTAQSSPPKVSTAKATIASTSSGSEMSARTNAASPPPSRMARALSSPVSRSISAITTLAPSRANRLAQARPNPRPAPVTSATFPASDAIFQLSLEARLKRAARVPQSRLASRAGTGTGLHGGDDGYRLYRNQARGP
jgi:hypothetical protein